MMAKKARYSIRCTNCKTEMPPQYARPLCMKCKGILEIKVDLSWLATQTEWRTPQLGVWRYKPLLPINPDMAPVTLGEGDTPILKTPKLQEHVGLKRLYLKVEGSNPTGSFKDRGMTVGITHAVELHERTVICASTGNTSASLAAYAARAGLSTIILIPSGGVAAGKLSQAAAMGAHILEVEGNFDEALELLLSSSDWQGPYIMNSINPFRIEGQKTVAFEIYEQLGQAPDNLVLPVGNAGNISAIWKGFSELKELGVIEGLPRMIGVQSAGSSPIADAVQGGRTSIKAVDKPETIASAIRIGRPVSWRKALMAIYGSRGTAVAVSDDAIINAQRSLATLEGIFVEPASAAPIAAIESLLRRNIIRSDELTVCIATGHGLKDPESPVCRVSTTRIKADIDGLGNGLRSITSPPLVQRSN